MHSNADVRAEAGTQNISVELKEFLTAIAYLKRKSKVLAQYLLSKAGSWLKGKAKQISTNSSVIVALILTFPVMITGTLIAIAVAVGGTGTTGVVNITAVQNVKQAIATDTTMQTYTLGTLTKRNPTYVQSKSISLPTIKYQAIVTEDNVVLELHQLSGEAILIEGEDTETIEFTEGTTESEANEAYTEDEASEPQNEVAPLEARTSSEDEFTEYIPVITLDYEWETFEMPYEHQKFIWETCKKYDGVEFLDIMSIIARESRFDPNATNGSYFGYMQVGNSAIEGAEERLGIEVTNIFDPYQNLTIGIDVFAYQLSRTPNKYAAHWAYASGYWGYLEDIENGKTSNKFVDKAYRYYDMLSDTELNPRG